MVKRGPCYGLKHQKEKRSMDHFAGLDVSVKETSVCVVDDTGKIIREGKVASEPEALLAVLTNPAYHFKRIGLEAGPLSQWLYSALAEAELPVVCVETRHMQAVLKAQINKTDRNDARGIAQMMRVGLYRPVHVKTLRSQKLRMLLTHRKLLQSKAIAIENDLRGTLRNFGLKVGMVGTVKFEGRIKELVENLPDLAILVEPLLIVRRALREQIVILHRRLLVIVRDDEVCRRLMTTPGVGPVVALTYRATVGGGIVDSRSVTTLRGCCSETLLKPAWMLNHRFRTNEKEEQTDDARLQKQIMIVAHSSWVLLSSLLEPAALCAAGSFYVRERDSGRSEVSPCSGRGQALRGSDVDNSISVLVALSA